MIALPPLPPQLPYYVIMLAVLWTAFGAGLGAVSGARPRWFLLEAAGLALVGVGMALIFLVVSPAPAAPREGLRVAARWLLLTGGLLWLLWSPLYLRHIVRVRRGTGDA